MTKINCILLAILLLVGFVSVTACKNEVIYEQKNAQAERQESQKDSILARDYFVAKRALDKAVREMDLDTIRLGLKGISFDIRKDAVAEIRKLNDKSLVPDLADALEANQGALSGGSEVIVLQQELNKVIVSGLEQLTGLRFPYFNDSPNFSHFSLSLREDIKKILDETREWYRTYSAKMPEKQKAPLILSKNYSVAKQVLDKAVLEKDKATIRLGLKNGSSLLIVKDSVKAIKQLNDNSFVQDLIEALEKNQLLMSGGSETQFAQQEINVEIISALKQLTKLEFSYLNESSTIPCFSDCPSKDIERVLKESREWLKKNPKEILQNGKPH